jgi:toxin ParE1/3/4
VTLPIVWRPAAADALVAIAGYIAQFNESAASGLVMRIELAAMRLPDMPYMAPVGRVPGTRELVVHPNYIMVYQVTASAIEILAVLHAREQYP